MIVDNALYRRGVRVPCGVPTDDLAGVRSLATGPDDFVWIGLHEPTEEELTAVQVLYDLHPLAVEDALTAHQRPKLERYADSLFLTLKTLWYVDEDDAVETGEINLFVGDRFVVSVRHGAGAGLHEARMHLEEQENVLRHGPSAVVYAICDTVVDRYEAVVGDLQNDVDEIEEAVFAEQRSNDSAGSSRISTRIYVLKRELAEMRRAVGPLRDPIGRMASGAVAGIHDDASPYFRDVADHLVRVAETVDNLDLLLSSAFEAHVAQISIRQNNDMRKISAGAALVLVPTLIAGIYGMNFDHIPELHWLLGYPFALALMIGVSVYLYVRFKRSGWL